MLIGWTVVEMAIFRRWRWRPSAILDFQKLEILTADTIRRVNMRYRAKFHSLRSNRCWEWDMAIFKTAAVDRHLEFLKIRNFKCRYGSKTQCKSPRHISCRSVNHCRDMATFQFLQIAAIRHRGFVIRVFGPPTKRICWSLSKFGWTRCSNFDNVQVVILCALGLKVSTYGLFGGGGFQPQYGQQCQRDAKKAPPCSETGHNV